MGGVSRWRRHWRSRQRSSPPLSAPMTLEKAWRHSSKSANPPSTDADRVLHPGCEAGQAAPPDQRQDQLGPVGDHRASQPPREVQLLGPCEAYASGQRVQPEAPPTADRAHVDDLDEASVLPSRDDQPIRYPKGADPSGHLHRRSHPATLLVGESNGLGIRHPFRMGREVGRRLPYGIERRRDEDRNRHGRHQLSVDGGRLLDRRGIIEPMLYVDHAATTPMRPEVLEAMQPFGADLFGNPSGVHGISRRAKDVLEEARERVAAVLQCEPLEVVFTGGGTEADNLAIK